mgnify:CR=1 FL=1
MEDSDYENIVQGIGYTEDPNSYRDIALENNIFKILTKMLTERLTKEVDEQILVCQFGFRKNKSTLQAVKSLQQEIENALKEPKGKYHVFIDYKKAFDTINREKLLWKLNLMIGAGPTTL